MGRTSHLPDVCGESTRSSYLMRIKAIEYDTQRATIYPIYKQLFDAVKKPGEFIFSLFLGGKVFDLMLYAAPALYQPGLGPGGGRD